MGSEPCDLLLTQLLDLWLFELLEKSMGFWMKFVCKRPRRSRDRHQTLFPTVTLNPPREGRGFYNQLTRWSWLWLVFCLARFPETLRSPRRSLFLSVKCNNVRQTTHNATLCRRWCHAGTLSIQKEHLPLWIHKRRDLEYNTNPAGFTIQSVPQSRVELSVCMCAGCETRLRHAFYRWSNDVCLVRYPVWQAEANVVLFAYQWCQIQVKVKSSPPASLSQLVPAHTFGRGRSSNTTLHVEQSYMCGDWCEVM